MVGTIGLAGGRGSGGRIMRWVIRLGAPHALMASLTGALVGTLVAMVGGATAATVGQAPVWVLGLVLALTAAAEVAGFPAQYLARAKQVPMSWKQVFPAPMSAAIYGATLGAGVLSTVYFWSFYALLLALLILGNVAFGALGGAAYGLGRALPVLATGLLLRNPSTVDRVTEFLAPRARLLRQLSALSITGAAVGLVLSR
jgi:hypothetical protein